MELLIIPRGYSLRRRNTLPRLENFNYCPQNLQLASRLWPRAVDPRFVSGMYRRYAYVFVTIMRRLQSIHSLCIHGVFPKRIAHNTIKLFKLFRLEEIAIGIKIPRKVARIIVWSELLLAISCILIFVARFIQRI